MTRCSPKCECRVRRFWSGQCEVGSGSPNGGIPNVNSSHEFRNMNLKNELGDAAPTPEAASPRFAVAETATVWASVSEADAHPFLNSEQRAARPLQHSAPSVSVHEHMSVRAPRGVVESRPKDLRPRNSGLSPFRTARVCDQIAPTCKFLEYATLQEFCKETRATQCHCVGLSGVPPVSVDSEGVCNNPT